MQKKDFSIVTSLQVDRHFLERTRSIARCQSSTPSIRKRFYFKWVNLQLLVSGVAILLAEKRNHLEITYVVTAASFRSQ